MPEVTTTTRSCVACEAEVTDNGSLSEDSAGNIVCGECEDDVLRCADCGEYVNIEDSNYIEDCDHSVCSYCYDDNYSCCALCDNMFSNDSMDEIDGNMVCCECNDNNQVECTSCGEAFISIGSERECNTCRDELQSIESSEYIQDGHSSIETGTYRVQDAIRDGYNPLTRDYSTECNRKYKKRPGKKDSKLFPFKRYCGVEVELLSPMDRDSFNTELNTYGYGLSWYTDGSINNERLSDCSGYEIKTDPGYTSSLEKMLKRLAIVCKRVEAEVNMSCGLHVHYDVSDMNSDEDMNKIYKTYFAIEPLLYSFVPKSRREKRFSESFRGKGFSFDSFRDYDRIGFDSIFYKTVSKDSKQSHKKDHSHASRYAGVNLHSVYFRDTLEIRIHSGTTNPQKIQNWVLLNYYIIDWIQNKYDEKMLRSLNSVEAVGPRTELFFELFEIPKELRQFYRERQKQFEATLPKDMFKN